MAKMVKIGDLIKGTKSGTALLILMAELKAVVDRLKSEALFIVVTQLENRISSLLNEEMDLEPFLPKQEPDKPLPKQGPAKKAEPDKPKTGDTSQTEGAPPTTPPTNEVNHIKLHLPYDKRLDAELRGALPQGVFWSSKHSDFVVKPENADKLEAFLKKKYPGKLLARHPEHPIWTVVEHEDEAEGFVCTKL